MVRRNFVIRIVCVFALATLCRGQVSLKTATNELTLETDSTKAVLRGAAIVSFLNKHTGQNYVVQPGGDWVSLNLSEPVERPMMPGKWELLTTESGTQEGQIQFQDETRTVVLKAGVDAGSGEIYIRAAGTAAHEGVQSLFWGMFGFDLANARMVVPGQAGTYYGQDTVPETYGLDYPVHWESQFIVYEHKQGSVLIYAHDTKPYFKRLHASRVNGTLDFGFEVFAVAPWDKAVDTPELEWRFKSFSGNWKEPAAYYKQWWSQNGLQPKPALPARPEWTKDVNIVVTVQYLDIPTLEYMAKMIHASKTMLYLTDWRKDGFDLNYPDYNWPETTTKYIQRARELGFRIMLHTNLLGVSETNPNFAQMSKYQLRTANAGEPVGWLWDLEPGHIRRVGYISPCVPEYRKLFIESIRPAVEALKPDAIHLDAGGAVINDANGLYNGKNSIEGLFDFHAEIQAAFPEVQLGYESLTEINAAFIRYAQRWSSITPAHPISTFLYGNEVLNFGFLDQPHPDENEFTTYLKRYEGQGIMPTAPVASMDDFDGSRPRTYRLFELFRLWQEYQFRPDWETDDWGEGTIFRYRSRDGKTTAHVESRDNFIRLYIGDDIFYERIHDATSAETAHHVRDWPAFDGNRLVGLDPDEQYWLEPDVPKTDDKPRLSELPADLRIGKQTFVSPEAALFTIERNIPPSYDFVANFWHAKTGTMFTSPLRERPMVAGALARMNPVFVGGKLRNSVLLMHPPYQGVVGGVTFTEYDIDVPVAHKIEFHFDVALADVALRREPATFVVWVDGKELWRNYVGRDSWEHGIVDLTNFSGRKIKLRLISGPGRRNIATYAYTCWSDLKIVTDPERQGASFRLHSPGGLAASSDEVTLQSTQEATAWEAKLDVPGRFAVFAKQPETAGPGKTLFDYDFRSFRSAFRSLPSPYESPVNVFTQDVQVTESSSIGLLFVQPPRNGRIYVSWAVRLAEDVQRLDFDYGLMEPAPEYRHLNIQYSGAEYFVHINGEQVWSGESRTSIAQPGSVDLSKWAGKPVLIQLVIDASGSAIYDWGFFSKLNLR